jgi:hypothetical protein
MYNNNYYIKSKGSLQTFVNNNNNNNNQFNEIDWDAGYDGDVANVILSSNNNGKSSNSIESVSNNLSIKELSNNKSIYKSENKELTQSRKIPLITKIEEHKINQERANRNFNEYKKYL